MPQCVHTLAMIEAPACADPRARRKPGGWCVGVALGSALLLGGCAAGVGIGIPIAPGLSIGVGVGSDGNASVGLGTGVGPVGVGVGVNQSGQVTGNTGVGVGTSVGGANVGVGVGTGTVLYDPAASPADAARAQPAPSGTPQQGVVVPASPAPAGAGEGDVQWRGANGQSVPDCKFRNAC